MTRLKDTELTTEKQPPNGFAPIPSELFGPLCQLSHVDRSVFLMLCLKANREWEPRGVLRNSINDVAMWCSTSRGCIRRALKNLDAAELIEYFRGGIRVIHYKAGKCTQVDQADPHPDHTDPTPDQADPLPGSHGSAIPPQPQQSIDDIPPLYGIDGSKDGSEDAAAAKKPPRKRVKPFLYWDGRERIKAREDDPRFIAWLKKWTELLGSEERVDEETEKAILWLQKRPDRVADMKSYEKFMDNWLEKEIPK